MMDHDGQAERRGVGCHRDTSRALHPWCTGNASTPAPPNAGPARSGRILAAPRDRGAFRYAASSSRTRYIAVRVGMFACCAGFMLLAGCIPGQEMSVRGDNSYVQLVPITPQLVSSEHTANPAPVIPAALLDVQPQPYRIGPGDTLFITVWDHPELTSPAGPQQQTVANGRLVGPDGTIYYPFIGKVKVAGLTLDQARNMISSDLAHWIKNPQVGINIVDYASQHVVLEGALVKSGTQSITSVPLTLAEAIANAGVDNQNANLSNVVLTRDGQSYHLNLSGMAGRGGPAGHVYLEAGDRVLVPYNDREKVYVMGEVTRPQALRFKTGSITLTQALGDAGGLNEVTSKGMIYVVRGAFDQHGRQVQRPTVYELDVTSPAAFVLADAFDVKPGDVVFASAAGITRWNRFMSQLLPLTSALSSTATANYFINTK